jgi:hypothetical protein
MNRAVEIVNSLRTGMNTILKSGSGRKINSLRMFNFEKNRVSLRMEFIDHENVSHPMGLIDVIEYPTGEKNRVSCNCHMTELATGKTEKLVLKLKNQDEQKIECAKVFDFFSKVLNQPEKGENTQVLENLGGVTEESVENDITHEGNLFPPSDGQLPSNPRGAQ